MYNQIVIFINQHRRNRGAEAHAVCRAVLSKLLRSDLDHVLPLGAGAAPVKRFELTRKLGFKPIAELTYDCRTGDLPFLEASHAIAHDGKRGVPSGGFCQLKAEAVLIRLLDNAPICFCCSYQSHIAHS